MHTYIDTYIQKDRHTYIHTERQTDRQRQTDRHTDIHTYRKTDRQTYIYIYVYPISWVASHLEPRKLLSFHLT